jgi:urea transporter
MSPLVAATERAQPPPGVARVAPTRAGTSGSRLAARLLRWNRRPSVAGSWHRPAHLREHAGAVLNSYSDVLFLSDPWSGAFILLVTLLTPNVAFSGLVAVLAAYAFARLVRMDMQFLRSGFYTYNPLLVGLSLGYLFRLTPLTLFFIVAAGISAFVLTHVLFSPAWYYLRLPVLSLPFVLISSMAYLAAASYTNLYVSALYPRGVTPLETALPLWLGGFLRSLGAIFFMPSALAGLLIGAALFYRSRILFILAAAGYYTGTLMLAALGGSTALAFSNVNTFNFILIAMAVGGVFLVATPRSYLLALTAVLTSTILLSSSEVFWSRWGVPVFALPFNVVTLSFVYLLGLVEYPDIARRVGTPEDVLDDHITSASRFRGSVRTLALPFAGAWHVWQAFDGPWTHQGPWRHAYDFVVFQPDGSTYRGDGTRLEDYAAFRKPVLSPIRGRVVRVVDGLPDNPPGEVDRAHNWGNLVVLKDERGFHVEISHFASNSIRVEEGAWVERGALLGLCGNSGYSPQPHIHLQVQLSEQVGAPTVPFSFAAYRMGSEYHANDRPPVGASVEQLLPERGLENRVGFVLDEVHRFRVRAATPKDTAPDALLTLVVRMAADGSFHLDSGSGRLFFETREGTFYFRRMEGGDPYLAVLFLALPMMPLAFRRDLTWSDHVPAGVVTAGLRRAVVRLLRSVYPALGNVTVCLAFDGGDVIRGRVSSGLLRADIETRTVLHPVRGFESVRAGNLLLERMHEDAGNGSP